MITKPLLILAFNRATHVKRLIDSLRPHAPQKILVSVDGPRINNKNDSEKIAQVLKEIKKIDWTQDIELRIRDSNLGLRFAVADAVTWVIDKYGEVIVVEDDIEVGPEFLDFMNQMLDQYRNDKRIGHISGYNLVPVMNISNPQVDYRLSAFPESYAWATWGDRWEKYNPDLNTREILRLLDNFFGKHISINKMVWFLNFYDAGKGSIDTWAYRWLASLWRENSLCVSPNRNLIKYTGRLDGTHVRSIPSYSEIEISKLPNLAPSISSLTVDAIADKWISEIVFRATHLGLIRRIIESILLRSIKLLQRK